MALGAECIAYQSVSIGSINTVHGHWGFDVLSRSGVGPDAVQSGRARGRGELLDGGTQARAGDARGEHDGGRGKETSKEKRLGIGERCKRRAEGFNCRCCSGEPEINRVDVRSSTHGLCSHVGAASEDRVPPALVFLVCPAQHHI